MRVPECKFYDSKMRPLLLVYDNPDTLSVLKDVRIMFKHGDGKYVCEIYIYITSVKDVSNLKLPRARSAQGL